MSERRTRILYMEDDPGQARLLQKRLESAGYHVTLASNGEEGLAMFDAGVFDIVAVDQNMPVYNGLEVIRRLAERGPLPPIIMVTGTGSEQIAVQAMKMGARDYIVKDVEGGYLELLPTVIEQVLEQHRLAEEKRAADEALRKYMAELEARNQELDAFAHTVAHDLRNPLTQIIGYAELLADMYRGQVPDLLLDGLERIAKRGWTMSNIINELLLLAKVRNTEVEIAPVDMASVVGHAVERLEYMIQESGAQLIVPDTWPIAMGHAQWIEEVWANYISNAIKYGGRPPLITLGAEELPEGWVRFWVRDNGPGIPPEKQTCLFTPFTRLNQVRAEGHGLGLSIVRRIVEKLGGEVGVESEMGVGSTFSFTLPACIQQNALAMLDAEE